MKFKVTRTSLALAHKDDESPCPGAYKVDVTSATSHWFINLESMTDLVRFQATHGTLVLSENRQIEICDDWPCQALEARHE